MGKGNAGHRAGISDMLPSPQTPSPDIQRMTSLSYSHTYNCLMTEQVVLLLGAVIPRNEEVKIGFNKCFYTVGLSMTCVQPKT